MQATRFYPRDSDGLPLGPLDPPPPHGPWDDCFTGLTWPIGLTWPGALSLSLTSTCDHVVLYDQQPHAICVEPQSGPPDAANLGRAYTVRPDEPLVIETQLARSEEHTSELQSLVRISYAVFCLKKKKQ